MDYYNKLRDLVINLRSVGDLDRFREDVEVLLERQKEIVTPKLYDLWEIGIVDSNKGMINRMSYDDDYINIPWEDAIRITTKLNTNNYWFYVALPVGIKPTKGD